MATGYGGYFLRELSSGLQSGLNMGQQIQEMQWQKAQRKKLEEKEKNIEESMSTVGNLFDQYGADNVYSDDEIMQLNTALSAAVPEVQAVYKDAVNAIQTINKRKFDEDLQWFDLFISQAEGLNPGDVQGIFDMAKSRFQTDKAKNYFTAYEEIQKKKYGKTQEAETLEKSKYLPEEYRYPYLKEKGIFGEITPTEAPKEPKMSDEKSAIDVLKIFVGASPEIFEKQRKDIEQRTGLNLSNYTQEILKESGSELSNLYNTPEEVMANVKPPKDLIVVPARDSKTGKYYGSFQKKTIPTPVVVRMVDPNDVLFGTNGIMKDYINSGSQLGEEQKAEIRNNYNVIKPALSEETRKQVEDYLGQIGIDVNESITEPTPELEPKTEPGTIQKGINTVKGWLNMKGIPKTEEIPSAKVPTEGKEAMIPMMSNDELYNALKGLDPSDPIYKALYDEAVKRGLIEK